MSQSESLRDVAIVELARALYGEQQPGELSLRAAARCVDAIAAHSVEVYIVRADRELHPERVERVFVAAPDGTLTEVPAPKR